MRTLGERLAGLPAGLLVQGKDAGAWPAVRAVLDPEVRGGQLWGPRRLGLRGRPMPEPLYRHLTNSEVAAHLWDASCALADVDPGLGPRAGTP